MSLRKNNPFDYSDYKFAGSIHSIELDASAKNIVVNGTVGLKDLSEIDNISAYVLPIYTDEFSADYSRLVPFASIKESFQKTFLFYTPLEALNDIDSRYQEVFTSKIAVVVKKKDGSRQLVDYARFLENPEVGTLNSEPVIRQPSIKGVGLLIPSDLEHLGVHYTTINVLLWQMLTLTDHGKSSIPYLYEGETYYFRRDYIEEIDNILMTCTANNISVLAILIMKDIFNEDPDSPAKYYAHPDAVNAVDLIVVDMTNRRSIQYYKAIISFLAKRYSRPDKAYGQFEGYIVGNEIGTTTAWNYMGIQTLEDYVDQYCRWLRLTNTIVKHTRADARVYASFDHFWDNRELQPDFVSFKNVDVYNSLVDLSKRQGNFGWNVTWHPYPENIYKIDTWNDPGCEDSFDTKFITFKNIQVLSRIMQKPENMFRGAPRRIILSEQGFTSTDNSPENQTLQAAAYAYAYYKTICVPGIDIFSMNGHIDNGAEMGLKLGLWTAKKGTVNQADQKKAIYDVFEKIDTVDSLKATAFALDVIGKSMGKTITDWKQVIPEFDLNIIREKCNRPVLSTAPVVKKAKLQNIKVISQNSKTRWSATDDTGSLVFKKDKDTGKNTPSVSILEKIYDRNIPKDYKGMTYTPARAINLTETPVVSVDAKITGIGEGRQAEFILRVYSGDNVVESETYTAAAEKWNTITVDLSGWNGLAAVDRIKVWVRPHDEMHLSAGTVSVNNLQKASKADIKA